MISIAEIVMIPFDRLTIDQLVHETSSHKLIFSSTTHGTQSTPAPSTIGSCDLVATHCLCILLKLAA